MTPQNEVLLIVGMMLVTFGSRYPVLALLSKRDLPEQFKLALNYVPVAVLTAIIVPEVLAPEGELFFNLSNNALAASLIAILVSVRTRNLLLTIVAGMGVYWLWGLIS